ncbi:MAG TPA: hypothetical protein VK395_36570 [Gemmataceae bacterium]|nr:hypothetical protein [Gemmataceae bacterium]
MDHTAVHARRGPVLGDGLRPAAVPTVGLPSDRQPARHSVQIETEPFWLAKFDYLHCHACRKGLIRQAEALALFLGWGLAQAELKRLATCC